MHDGEALENTEARVGGAVVVGVVAEPGLVEEMLENI